MIDKIKHRYQMYMQERGDTRVASFWLMDDVAFTVCMSILYIVAVKYVGPKVMENRKPFILKNVLLVYNAFQIILSAYIFNQLFEIEWFTTSRLWRCQPINYLPTDKTGMTILKAYYVYYLSKFTEYLDTVFFVLRKKNNQITFLHLFHHASMPIWMWFATKFFGGGSMTVIPLFNSFVHIIMYSYYLLAGLGPKIQKYLWWKKYITTLQLIQFLVGTIHFICAVFDTNPKCNIPKSAFTLGFSMGIFFYILFSNFYNKAYGKETPKKKVDSDTHKNTNKKVKPL